MIIEPIGLQHRELVHSKYQEMGAPLSEFSFASLYLFRRQYATQIVLGKNPYIKGLTYEGEECISLCAPPHLLDKEELFELLASCPLLYPITENWRPYFDPKLFQISYLESDSDYMFTVEKLATFPGRDLSRKRNLEKHFKDHYAATIEKFTEKHASDAVKVLDHWLAATQQNAAETDYEACKESFELLSQLNLEGRIYYVDKEPVGFLIGEPLNSETFVLHFAKANIDLKGIYPFMYQTFAEECLGKYRYLNMEQDLGHPNLIKAKKTYHPDFYNIKLRVVHAPST